MAPEVRLSGPNNEPLGIVSLQEALRMAGELDVDLVEIAATANPQTITTDPTSGVKFFAGEVDDPFFFDIPGFSRFRASVRLSPPGRS